MVGIPILRCRAMPHSSKSACDGATVAYGWLKDQYGSALLEFAIVLPLLVVFVVGIYDFSGAFNQKQKIEQAAQEGAIIAGAQPTSDIQSSNGNPASLQAVVTAVLNSLLASGVLTNAACGPYTITPPSGNLIWTYKITGCDSNFPSDNLILTINRGWISVASTPAVVGTAVTVQYPYHWRFNTAIQLLIPGATYAAITQLTESSTVHNQL